MLQEADQVLTLLGELDVPLIPKINALLPTAVASRLAEHPSVDAVCVSNTIPWGELPDRIPWKRLFGSETSPLAKYRGGGLSGAPLLPIVEDWIRKARPLIQKPIIGGGGVLSCSDADRLLDAGANAIELGSVSILRPWRVRGIVQYVNIRRGNEIPRHVF